SRMGGDGASVQEVPGFTICINRPSANDPGVTEIHSVIAWPLHLPVGICNQYRLSLMDRDLRRPNLNLGCHFARPFRRCRDDEIVEFPSLTALSAWDYDPDDNATEGSFVSDNFRGGN